MRHRYECPMRWADLDLLGHVNNVVYVDYLQEARVDMLRAHGRPEATRDLVEGLVVVQHDVSYLHPLHFRFRPVLIDCWVTEVRAATFTMAYEVYDEEPSAPEGRTVYLRATTVLTPYVFAEERPRRLTPEERATLEGLHEESGPVDAPGRTPARVTDLGHYPVAVRFSDVDVFGHVNNVKYFEYLQEARIVLMARLWDGLPAAVRRPAVVVARTEVTYRRPILFRQEPYDAWSWFSHVGRTSAVVESEIRDGEETLARSRVVLVFVDATSQRPAPPEPSIRERLVAFAGA